MLMENQLTVEHTANLSLEARMLLLVKKRWEFVHTDAMGIAYLLDPHTDPEGFVGDDEDSAINDAVDYTVRTKMIERLRTTPTAFRGALTRFAADKRRWSEDSRQQYVDTSPRDFWGTKQKKYPLLCELAELVFSVPSSSAASERAWSIYDLIHTKKRNRLSKAKIEMLAYIYINHDVDKRAEEMASRGYRGPSENGSASYVDLESPPVDIVRRVSATTMTTNPFR